MVRKKVACEECERTCQLLHGCKRDLEPMVSRFFKIMIGTDFNEALFLPPKFVKNVKNLVGQETVLEDSRGICWTVALSYYKGKLAFRKGWDKFSVDKDLKVGDILIFNHFKGGHFVVLTFGRDACEKLNTAIKHRPLKRARTSENKVADNAPYHTSRRGTRNTRSSKAFVQMQPTEINCIPKCEAENRKQLWADSDLYMMVDRDAGYVQCDDRTWLYDLSNYEMPQNIHSVDMNKECINGQEVNPDAARRSVKLQSDWDLNDKSTNEMMVSSMETVITPDTNIVRCIKSEPTRNMSVEHEDNHLDDHPLAASIRHDVIEGDDILNVAVLPQSRRQIKDSDSPQCPQNRNRRNSEAKIEMVKNMKVERGEETYGCGQKREAKIEMVKKVKVERGEETYGCGQKREAKIEMVKKVKVERGEETYGCDQKREAKIEMLKKVKVERGEETYGCGRKRASVSATREEDGNSFAASEMSKNVRIVQVPSSVTSSTQTNGNTNLTECWPKVSFPVNREGRISVILEDPEGREWAGLYYEHRGLRALLASWDKIKAQNKIQPGDHLAFSIQPGDHLAFRAADTNVSKYKFYIDRK